MGIFGRKSITVDGITLTAKKGKLKPEVIKLAKKELAKSNRTEYTVECHKGQPWFDTVDDYTD